MFRADLAVFDSKNRLVLIVEVKRTMTPTTDWAIGIRRNMLAHGRLPKTRFFILACPERLFLWKETTGVETSRAPDYEVDAMDQFSSYFEEAWVTPQDISGQSFSLILQYWLGELAIKGLSEYDKNLEWFIESGLMKGISGGRVEREVSI